MTGPGTGIEVEGTGIEVEGTGIEVEGVGVRYFGRREPALTDVSLSVSGGEMVGVAGRTGAGKSTLALVAAGFIPRVVRAAVSGRASVGGVSATTADARALAGRVGIVFATPANQLSASKLTVREELAFGLENLGVPRGEMDGRIDTVLARLAIEHLAEREPFALSGGEQQRVAIASILVMGTGAIVLDEPTAQLDPAGTRSVAALLAAAAADGRAVLLVEGDPSILGLVGRCLVLDSGRSIALAPPGEALGDPVLGPLGLRAPTVVRLAAMASVEAGSAFDERAVAAGLAKRAAGGDLRTTGGAPAPALDWAPSRERPTPALEVRGLVHRYPGGVEALRGVELAIQPGETVAIVGQNGSGKTTLAKHLDGLLRPDSGTVLLDGADIADRPVHELARSVGFVFQDPDDQLFNRSVEREVSFGPRNLGLPDAEVPGVVDRALRLAGLEDVRATNPYDLGLSTRKLVALASVLAMEPPILVLDEPTTGQDGPGIERIGAIVEAYRSAGRTVLAITHDMEFAARHFRRIVVMRAGRVVGDGPPETIFGPDGAERLASTGLEPPVAARIGARLGLGSTPTEEALVAALAATRLGGG
jgi:energy-coupling factor transporter ATP-binding protein EcfA2